MVEKITLANGRIYKLIFGIQPLLVMNITSLDLNYIKISFRAASFVDRSNYSVEVNVVGKVFASSNLRTIRPVAYYVAYS